MQVKPMRARENMSLRKFDWRGGISGWLIRLVFFIWLLFSSIAPQLAVLATHIVLQPHPLRQQAICIICSNPSRLVGTWCSCDDLVGSSCAGVEYRVTRQDSLWVCFLVSWKGLVTNAASTSQRLSVMGRLRNANTKIGAVIHRSYTGQHNVCWLVQM